MDTGILLKLLELAMNGKAWADNIAAFFGITSYAWRFAIYGVLGLIALEIVVLFFKGGKWVWKLLGKKSKPISMAHTDGTKQEDDTKLNGIEALLKDRHEVVLFTAGVSHTIFMKEDLSFEWSINEYLLAGLWRWLWDKVYEARLTGTIEGRIDLQNIKVCIERKKLPTLDDIIVHVSIPAGFFVADFGFDNVKEIKNEAGLLTSKYSEYKIQEAFKKEYPLTVRKRIEDEKMIEKTQYNARLDIESFISGFMEALGFKKSPGVKHYAVEPEFMPGKWRIYKPAGAERKLIGEIEVKEQPSEAQENNTPQEASSQS